MRFLRFLKVDKSQVNNITWLFLTTYSNLTQLTQY